MSIKPAISVIVPVYNVEPYIARCARSLFGQTLDDMEYIFVDDCTPDKSMEIMRQVLEEEFPARIPQVKVFRMPKNSGQAQVRMQGISMATGDYLTHCDSDDEVDVDTYRQMYEKAIAESLDIVTCDFKLVGLKKPGIQSQHSNPGREVPDILLGKVWGNLCCRLIKRELLSDIIPPNGDMWEDVVLTIQAMVRANRFGYIPVPLYCYYRRSSSISFEGGLQANLNRWMSICSNARIVIDYLADKSSIKWTSTDMISFKYRCRASLIPYVHIPEYYSKWRNTFPEIDHVFLYTKGVSMETKFWFILIHLHLYHYFKSITGFVRRIIN